jgi:predicted TIM-barrel fold metal-dependent hydrolase
MLLTISAARSSASCLGLRGQGSETDVEDVVQVCLHLLRRGLLPTRSRRRRGVLFSTDYPFHRPDAAAVERFFDAVPDPSDRSRIASGNAESLFRPV